MTSQVDDKPTTPMVGRRAVARGAAWSVPVVALAVAAPASAATSTTCVTGVLSWDNFASGSVQTGKVLATTVPNLTLMVTTSGDNGADNNGQVTSTTTGGLSKVMRFYDLNNKSNTSQTITLTFSKAVRNVQFSLLDVDSASSRRETSYEDLVIINTAGWTGTKHSNVTGSGTTSAPYRAVNTDSPVDGSSNASNVDLAWAGPISSISFTYKQDGSVDGDPFIGISDIAFQYCS
jgi:hypothetical protein